MLAVVIVTVVSAIISFLCSLMEAALYSIPPSRIEEMRSQGRAAGIRLSKLRENVDEPISAILTLNTVANSLGATLAGSLVGKIYGNLSAGLYGVLFTLIVLFFSEIIPKTLGVTYSQQVAPMMSGPLVFLIRALYPFVWLCRFVTKSIRKRAAAGGDAPSEREIQALAEMGAKAGTIYEDEARWATNALRLDQITARDIMTPRTVVYMLPADLPLNQVGAHSEHWTFSRLPLVKDDNPDNVVGIVHRRDVFDKLALAPKKSLETTTLNDLAQPARFVPDSIRGHELLRNFLKERQHLLIVSNEYGGMEGVVSLEDVLEFILGEEIVDAHDQYEDMQELARAQARQRLRAVREKAHSPQSKKEA
ncbi:MAG: hemolysin family protein [Sumerlaeia bacterium]